MGRPSALWLRLCIGCHTPRSHAMPECLESWLLLRRPRQAAAMTQVESANRVVDLDCALSSTVGVWEENQWVGILSASQINESNFKLE